MPIISGPDEAMGSSVQQDAQSLGVQGSEGQSFADRLRRFTGVFGSKGGSVQSGISPQSDGPQAPLESAGDAANFSASLSAPSMPLEPGVSSGPNLAVPESVAAPPPTVTDGQNTGMPTGVADASLSEVPGVDSAASANGIGSTIPEAALQAPSITGLGGLVAEPQVPVGLDGSVGVGISNINEKPTYDELAISLMNGAIDHMNSSRMAIENAIKEIRNLRVNPTETSTDTPATPPADVSKEPVGAGIT